MKTALEWLKLIGAIVGLIALGALPAVREFARLIDERRAWLLPLTLGMTIVGFLALLWGWVVTAIRLGQPMSHEEVEQLAARTRILGPGTPFSRARLWGKTAGTQVPEMGWTFQELKEAWQAGTWWRDPGMRMTYVITAGGTLFVSSGFALLMVLFEPPAVKFLLGGTVLYALGRLTWAFCAHDGWPSHRREGGAELGRSGFPLGPRGGSSCRAGSRERWHWSRARRAESAGPPPSCSRAKAPPSS
jgi:hypothetical protein